MARPKAQIDDNLVQRLAGIGCTVAEIARICECSKTTLEKGFHALIEKGRAEFRMSIRRKQWQVAEEGNPTMLIWLGKQYLDQTDKMETQQHGEVNVKVTHDDNFYGNAKRLAALANGTSVAGANGGGAAQDSGLRPAVGKNGSGDAGNGEGPRQQ